MVRIDTTLTVLDAHKHIVGGYIVPFHTRLLNGQFHSRSSHVEFKKKPLPIFADHDTTKDGIIGLAEIALRRFGYYATVQLYNHPHAAIYQDAIGKGQIAFSLDYFDDGTRIVEGDGFIRSEQPFGASLCAYPYIRPNHIPTQRYIELSKRYVKHVTQVTGVVWHMKDHDPQLEQMPIPAKYGEL